ncbi:hypothetical protein PAAG_01392 [Paracoccidioides lutzii Pb01]|uniref:Uncharacterized protein n=1 Tax=Paracoccidioides lutzii (strain ATCC MYA-826 / Pb01) TaxID=502779 RepID=C1GS97_PARBA|nr:hypothetical protein PAAG_01392 [Paracoccidioides lutzii Pb01]EEH38930.2 hypothetical protein PAAG_01392 [Paracoccidioides lutzii Pb01]
MASHSHSSGSNNLLYAVYVSELSKTKHLSRPPRIRGPLLKSEEISDLRQIHKNSHDKTTVHGVSTCSVLAEELMAIQISGLRNTASQTVAHRQRFLNLCHAPPVI